MNVDHRRALFAFFVVACVCALLVGQGVRPNSDFFDYIVGRSATPPTVAGTVTLEPDADDDGAAPRAGRRGESAPTDEGSAAVVDVASPAVAGGGGGGGSDSRPGKAPNHASAPDRGHSAGGGKPSRGGDKADRPSGKPDRARARAGDDTGGQADGNKSDRGKKKGHRKDRPASGNPGRGRAPH